LQLCVALAEQIYAAVPPKNAKFPLISFPKKLEITKKTAT
jgi:hypothetical protein